MPEPKNRKILIADDDPDELILMEASLAPLPFPLLLAKDGVEAWHLLQEQSQNIALVILDYDMPYKTGFELVALMKLRPVLREIPIILHTAQNGEQFKAYALQLGVNVFLPKSCESSELREAAMALIEPQYEYY